MKLQFRKQKLFLNGHAFYENIIYILTGARSFQFLIILLKSTLTQVIKAKRKTF